MAQSATNKQKKSSRKTIDSVPAKLKQSELYKTYKDLIDDLIAYVLPFWNKKWRFHSAFKQIVNKKKLSHEIEESIVALHFVLAMLAQIAVSDAPKQQQKSVSLIDLCSGKGILSLLLVSFIKLVPKYQHLCSCIDCIYLMDRNWDNLDYLEAEEMKEAKQDYAKRPKSPIKSDHLSIASMEFGIELVPIRCNIHHTKVYDFITGLGKECILLSIHLCRRLSVRAIKLFNGIKSIFAFLLAPCCLPLSGGLNVRIGPLWNKSLDLWQRQDQRYVDVNEEYLDEIEFGGGDGMKASSSSHGHSFQLVLLAQNEINERGKDLGNKYVLSDADIENLSRFKDDFAAMVIDKKKDKILIVNELNPKRLFEKDLDCRYNEWITFLFNGIDAKKQQKKIYKVPLTGNDHRCDVFMTCVRK